MDFDPALEIRGIVGGELQRGEVEVAFLVGVVVTAGAVLFGEGSGARGVEGGSERCRGGEGGGKDQPKGKNPSGE